MARTRSRWDDEYDSYQEDHDDSRITVDPTDESDPFRYEGVGWIS